MKRRGRSSLGDLFYNTGDMNERTVDESFGFSREFNDAVSESMLEEERIKRARLKRDQERDARLQNPPTESTAEGNPDVA